MAVQDYKINYKSDFVLNINGDAGWATQFCIKFWTGMPSQAYFVGFDGVKYVNCRVGDTPTQLLVMFDDHHLPIGKLMMQIAYHTTIEEFPGSVFDEVTNARDVIVTIDGTDYQVMLDFTGEDAPELEFDLPAYANEAERIQNELQRQQNEADRIAAELQREQATAAAVQGAENVNAQLNGTTLTVTNRNGVSTSVNTKGEQGEQGPVGPQGPQGEQGETGISIVSFTPKSETSTTLIYTVTFSDDTTQDISVPKGPQGDTGLTGNGISSTTLNSDYTLTIAYTDGTTYTTPSIRGAQGAQGVSVIGFTQTGETATNTMYNLVFSDGRTQSVAIPKGVKGDKGDAGNPGPQGAQGPKGDTVTATDYTLYNVQGGSSEGAMSQDATTKAISAQTGYYTCGTAAGTAAKVVTVESGNLYKRTLGGHFKVKMTNKNTAASGVTLQIGSETSAALLYNGEAISASNSWEEGEVISVYFDGTNYQASNSQGGGGKFETGQKVREVSIINDLLSGGSNNVLSAQQGKILSQYDYLLEDVIIDIENESGYVTDSFVRKTNVLAHYVGGISCQNIEIENSWLIGYITGTASQGAYHCLMNINNVVIATFQGTNEQIDFRNYPEAKYISITTIYGSLGLRVNKLSDKRIQEYMLGYSSAGMAYANELQKTYRLSFECVSGGYFSRDGNFHSKEGSKYTDKYQLVPTVATKVYYTGISHGTADGGILWFDASYTLIGYFSVGSKSEASQIETTIPSGAVYFKASSLSSNLAITFNAPTKSFENLDKIPSIEENVDFVNGIINTNFNEVVENVETPSVSTAAGGTVVSGTWGVVLTNSGTINLQSVKFYSSIVKTSFIIAIGSANIENKTYKIDKNYQIVAEVVAGENTIDVSSYGITIPPHSMVVCTGSTHYVSALSSGMSKIVGRLSSISAGVSGSYETNYNFCIQFELIGVMTTYTINIPPQSLVIALASNVLYGKKYVAIGDSFTAPIGSEVIESGPLAGMSKVYPYIIGNRNNMAVLNQGGSGTVLNGYLRLARYNDIPADVDYITIWYGINDSGHGISIGTVNDEPTSINAETDTTTCGGFNFFFKWLLTNRPLAHIGVIITDFTAQDRREAIMACCQKWGIPYLDLYDPTIPMIRTRGTTRYTHNTSIAPLGYVEVCAEAKALRNTVFSTDPSSGNMHPNNTCHEWQSNLVENFLRSL